jgi:hypothetical protein
MNREGNTLIEHYPLLETLNLDEEMLLAILHVK